LGQSALVRLEIRYARLVKRIKRSYQAFLQQLCMVHCYSLGLYIRETDFTIQSMEVSTAEEEERNNALAKLTETMESFVRFATALGRVNMDYFSRYILQSFMNLPNFDVDKFLTPPKGDNLQPSNQDAAPEGEPEEGSDIPDQGLGGSCAVLEGWGNADFDGDALTASSACTPEQFGFLAECAKPFMVVVDVLDFGYSCRPHLAYVGNVFEEAFETEDVDFADIAPDVVFTKRAFKVDMQKDRGKAIKLRVEQFDGRERFVVSQDSSATAFIALYERSVQRCQVMR